MTSNNNKISNHNRKFLSIQTSCRPLVSVTIPKATLVRNNDIIEQPVIYTSDIKKTPRELNYHGGIRAIRRKSVTDTGLIHYIVKWKDGHTTKSSPESLINFKNLVEEYEYEQFLKTDEQQSTPAIQPYDIQRDSSDDSHPDYLTTNKTQSYPKNIRHKKDTTSDDDYSEEEQIHYRKRKRRSSAKEDKTLRRSKRVTQPIEYNFNISDDHIVLSSDDSDSSMITSKHYRSTPQVRTVSTPIKKSTTKGTYNIAESNTNFARQHDQICNICKGSGDKLLNNKSIAVTNDRVLLLCRYCSNSTHPACVQSTKQYQLTTTTKETPVLSELGFSNTTTSDTNDIQKEPTYYHVCRQCYKGANDGKIDTGTCYICNKEFTFDGNDQRSNDPLFRCRNCTRAICSDCIHMDWETKNGKNSSDSDISNDKEQKKARAVENTWKTMECGTCRYFSGQDIETLLTWLPVNTNEEPTTTLLPCVNTKNPCTTDEDKSYRKNNDNTHRLDSTTKNRVFLVKWKDISYRHLDWVPETWLAGVSPMKYNNYLKKHYDQYPIKVEDAVPFYWKVIDRVLDTKQSQSGHVKMVFAKFRGLAYDQACWDTPPFEAQLTAPYHEALRRYRMMDSIKPVNEMKEHISILRSKLRADDFGRLRELKKQPDYVTNGTILPHQLDGLNWLIYQWEQQQPCILADDMGLGKTIQIVTFLDYLFNEYNIYPFLVVVPNSTVTNWIREFNKWAPDLVVAPYFGSSTSRDMARKYEIFRHGQQRNQISCHVVMMTYESALSGIRYFKNLDIWPYLIVDEAQRLKNMESQLFLKLAELNTDNRILLTGTPLQNNIEELFNIMHFIASSKFRDIDALTEYYREFTQDSIQELHRKLKPYFLRRTKEMVLVDLPPKKEIIVPISMTSLQKELYKETLTKGTKILAQLQKQSRGKINNKEIKKSGINYNNILMMLRKILNHPYLIPGVEIPQETQSATQQAMIDASGKLKLLKLILPKLRAQGHRVLLFSTMAIALDILEDYLVGEGIKFVRIDGNTPQLQRVTNMDIFNASDSDVDVFLLTSRAGGVGINLATADTVIIYDSDYNPHVDLQAISRAHRMGQKSPVLILRFATRLSVEESILNKAKKKMVLDHLVVDKMDEEEIEPDDIESIVKFGLKALFDEDDGPEDIVYDSAAVDELLDRDAQFKADTPSSSTTDTMDPATDDTTKDKKENGFMSFSFAKIWQKQKGPVDAQNDNLMQVNGEENQGKPDNADDDNVWERLLAKNREALEEEKLQQAEKLGRGARQRKVISYREQRPLAKALAKSSKTRNISQDKEATAPYNEDDDSTDTDYIQENEEEDDDEEYTEHDQRQSIHKSHPPPPAEVVSPDRSTSQVKASFPKPGYFMVPNALNQVPLLPATRILPHEPASSPYGSSVQNENDRTPRWHLPMSLDQARQVMLLTSQQLEQSISSKRQYQQIAARPVIPQQIPQQMQTSLSPSLLSNMHPGSSSDQIQQQHQQQQQLHQQQMNPQQMHQQQIYQHRFHQQPFINNDFNNFIYENVDKNHHVP